MVQVTEAQLFEMLGRVQAENQQLRNLLQQAQATIQQLKNVSVDEAVEKAAKPKK